MAQIAILFRLLIGRSDKIVNQQKKKTALTKPLRQAFQVTMIWTGSWYKFTSSYCVYNKQRIQICKLKRIGHCISYQHCSEDTTTLIALWPLFQTNRVK